MSTAQKALDSLAERVVLEGERVRAELQAGLTETRNAVAITAARSVPLPQTSQLLLAGRGRLTGWAVRVRGGTVLVTLRDGRDNGAEELAAFTMANNGEAVGSSAYSYPGAGVTVTEGLYFDLTVVSGTPVLGGALYFGAVD